MGHPGPVRGLAGGGGVQAAQRELRGGRGQHVQVRLQFRVPAVGFETTRLVFACETVWSANQSVNLCTYCNLL